MNLLSVFAPIVNSDQLLLFLPKLIVFLLYFVIPLVFVCYILYALGLYKMARRSADKETRRYAWFAFIPFLCCYLLGDLIKDDLPEPFTRKAKWILLVAPIVGLILVYLLPNIGALTIVPFYMAYYYLYKKYAERHILLLVWTTVSGGLLAPFFIFGLRNRTVRTEAYMDESSEALPKA
ncbi:hypothetical protein [Aureibacillus halotolerans]|uniref:Uncharacterized protein n=1 Tax=Aureibacillus halotolerans TaxID=1508390 RepID=A0A4R6TTQ6_9BACI|nr:hypothetical protein [Aureibacillus halotolerans]TDQ34160.1 hypothetical protein EV213_12625 [Aureibacillus halotolerans]